jgi:hypothetical protein
MTTVLHLLGGNDPTRALVVMAGQVAAGDAVTVALMGNAAPALPPGMTAYRVPAECSWDQLLDLVFSADQVISW